MTRDGSGFTKPTTAHTEFHRDHGRMVLSIPLTLGVRSGVQVLVRINHKLKRPRVLADPVLLSFFLSLTNWAELSLRKKCLKSRPQGFVFIEKGRPITAWPNRHDLVAEWVQLVPFPPFCHKLPPTAPFFLWADRSQAHNACPHTWIPSDPPWPHGPLTHGWSW